MGRTLRGVISSLLTCSLVIALAGSADAAITDPQRAARAAGFIADHQRPDGSFVVFSSVGSTADAVLAFVAARVGRREVRRALAFLEDSVLSGDVTTEGSIAKVVLAWTAAGRDRRVIGGVNLVHELRAGWSDGLTHTVYDTALAVLALRAAGASVPPAAISFLQTEVCADGGWSYDGFNPGEDEHCLGADDDRFASDTNTTALAVMALSGTSVTGEVAAANDAFDFFSAMRDPVHGGWGYTWRYPATDANSTGLVLQAYAADGRGAPAGSRQALRKLQYDRCWAFAYSWDGDTRTGPDLGATIGAVPGLLGKAFPYTAAVERPAPDTPACG